MRASLSNPHPPKRRALIVCGPTASGKSRLADELAYSLTETKGEEATTVAVDSMQVYREIPIITNQARDRPAELVGTVSVSEEWTVARHREAAREIIEWSTGPVVLDAGTGMYLNAVLLDLPLAPKVAPEVRSRAEEAVRALPALPNVRRAIRKEELRLAGAPPRGSIWEGEPILDATIVYLRPARDVLVEAIASRSARIAGLGLEEVETLREMEISGTLPNPSVMASIGVQELTENLQGGIPLPEAEQRIAIRTRRLARRQIRWFDKLTKKLEGKAAILIVSSPDDPQILHCMHDIMEA